MSRQAYPAEAAAPGTPRYRRANLAVPADRANWPQPPPPQPQPSKKSELILAAISAASMKISQKRVHPAAPQVERQQLQGKAAAPADVRVSEEEVLSVLECPVCFEYMEAPIYMCANGHNVCAVCLPRCRGACPSCRGALTASAARNLALERLAASAAGSPCRNAFAGCPERRLKASARAAHESCCPYEPLPCALGCGWRGANTSQQLRAHVLAAHARSATTVPDSDDSGRPLSAVQLGISQAGCFRSGDHVFFAFEHTFAYVKRFSVEERRLSLAVRFFGAADAACRFRYELCLQKGRDGDDYECTSFSRAVHHWSHDLSTVMEMKRCIVVDFETLVSFGKGTRTFKIVKIPERCHVAEERGVYRTELEPKTKVNTP
ncbi:E3 ubiquitin-protein ligase SIAH1B-like [Schistocerca gregaria]|uniref:E3 ubiquitin-protein ligase SIAH1B-like n=1 Tax=Schistocerca gregaria TaxID=7010 RepID=UPI00211E205E|nr:E3 ubiquitin-protein ligase SIAH1B-like [Schistocerca gregaria]XP_049852658.1 E3 ubiquitin-protein ligase SIAH1B-like [Schistocerca gregaria]XP_049852659.1 E3 ubiquitin-protein ligase SIAH1B-like [Schistocerca gregaria]XP_049852660.1 E3 ubiquitin-protein ligase SIAH1B-like [Schistocerca gregaria]XP_049852661.1 E3 ubiquitin-protein ligase SIAH1B-like [Schistocerca gregaria]